MLRNIIELLILLLTGGFALYALLNPYRVDGRITRAGKIAVIGCIGGIVLTVIGFGLRIRDAHNAEMNATEQLRQESQRYEDTLKKILSLHHSLANSRITISYSIRGASKNRPDLVEWFNVLAREDKADMVTSNAVYVHETTKYPDSPLEIPKPTLVIADAQTPLVDKILQPRTRDNPNGLLIIYTQTDDIFASDASYDRDSESVYLTIEYRVNVTSNTSRFQSVLDLDQTTHLGVTFAYPTKTNGL